MMQAVRSYADKVVQVPQMAESISEGTLKQFNKAIGDYVEQDEEIATIETDKVCLSAAAAPRHSRTLTSKLKIDRRRCKCPRVRHHQGVSRQRGRHCNRWAGPCPHRTG